MLATKKIVTNHKERDSIVKILTRVGKKHVVLLCGGMSHERDVSLLSASNVANALVAMNYQVTHIDVGSDIALQLHKIQQPYVVFNCLHGTYGEDGCIPGLLNIMDIPYTHSGLAASALAFDKNNSKVMLKYYNISTPASRVIDKESISGDPIARPYIIKPIQQGSSIGIKMVLPDDDFVVGNYDFAFGNQVLVEEYIDGRELQVAVLDGEVLGIMEIQLLQGKLFFDYQSKYYHGFPKKTTSPKLSEEITNKIITTSQQVYKIFQCRGPCRVDYMLSKENNELYMLELNTHPGVTSTSIFPAIAAAKNISFNELIDKILATAQCDKLN